MDSQAILIDIDSAAELLSTKPRHLKRLANEGRIPFVDLGDGLLRFSPEKLREWVQAIPPTEEAAAV